eukprot:3420344-Alexandrium_andersonii.AAC.1
MLVGAFPSMTWLMTESAKATVHWNHSSPGPPNRRACRAACTAGSRHPASSTTAATFTLKQCPPWRSRARRLGSSLRPTFRMFGASLRVMTYKCAMAVFGTALQ